ncbi:hypothetical protein GQ42DRAFT_153643 [Ramicandelaber brevisporus]|nr:hypothetical protein GQ42DRAFT_153643 [Ramicandelaber brevisporus]
MDIQQSPQYPSPASPVIPSVEASPSANVVLATNDAPATATSTTTVPDTVSLNPLPPQLVNDHFTSNIVRVSASASDIGQYCAPVTYQPRLATQSCGVLTDQTARKHSNGLQSDFDIMAATEALQIMPTGSYQSAFAAESLATQDDDDIDMSFASERSQIGYARRMSVVDGTLYATQHDHQAQQQLSIPPPPPPPSQPALDSIGLQMMHSTSLLHVQSGWPDVALSISAAGEGNDIVRISSSTPALVDSDNSHISFKSSIASTLTVETALGVQPAAAAATAAQEETRPDEPGQDNVQLQQHSTAHEPGGTIPWDPETTRVLAASQPPLFSLPQSPSLTADLSPEQQQQQQQQRRLPYGVQQLPTVAPSTSCGRTVSVNTTSTNSANKRLSTTDALVLLQQQWSARLIQLDMENKYLASQNLALERELLHSREATKALRTIVQQKDELVDRIQNDSAQLWHRIDSLEALVTQTTMSMFSQTRQDGDQTRPQSVLVAGSSVRPSELGLIDNGSNGTSDSQDAILALTSNISTQGDNAPSNSLSVLSLGLTSGTEHVIPTGSIRGRSRSLSYPNGRDARSKLSATMESIAGMISGSSNTKGSSSSNTNQPGPRSRAVTSIFANGGSNRHSTHGDVQFINLESAHTNGELHQNRLRSPPPPPPSQPFSIKPFGRRTLSFSLKPAKRPLRNRSDTTPAPGGIVVAENSTAQAARRSTSLQPHQHADLELSSNPESESAAAVPCDSSSSGPLSRIRNLPLAAHIIRALRRALVPNNAVSGQVSAADHKRHLRRTSAPAINIDEPLPSDEKLHNYQPEKSLGINEVVPAHPVGSNGSSGGGGGGIRRHLKGLLRTVTGRGRSNTSAVDTTCRTASASSNQTAVAVPISLFHPSVINA